jgi:hypothetical protein
MYGNGLYLTPQNAHGKRRVIYSLGVINPADGFSFPGRRQMKRLSRKFLNGELEELEEFPRTTRGFFFSIPVGTSAEDRAAFLGAVRHHCKEL